jgi:hypothetical protein
MKVLRNLLIIAAMVAAMPWTGGAQFWTNRCQDYFDSCKFSADLTKDDCYNQCDQQWLPNTFEWDQCRGNCNAAYNSSMTTCNADKSSCMGQRTNECRWSVCYGVCGSNNDVVTAQYIDSPACQCDCMCSPSSRPTYCPGGPNAAGCGPSGWVCNSPIVISLEPDRIELTSAANGVTFDLYGGGMTRQWAWTKPDSNDAWLALDRNGNDLIDNGTELFGSATAQPPPAEEDPLTNGFRALAVFDAAAEGGNEDGQIDQRDRVYASLRLWRDADHDGVSDPGELLTLPQAGIGRMDLGYQERRRVDRHGNFYKYRARIWDLQGRQRRWAWDVFLATTPET